MNQTFREYLEEARRNPEQNPKIGVVEALEPYKDNPDIYISFTEVDKIGINPKSGFNTPLGIYTYPLKEMWKDVKNDTIPWAGKAPYVWILKSKNGKGFIKNLYSDYSSKNYDDDMKKIKKLYKDNKEIQAEILHLKTNFPQHVDLTYEKYVNWIITDYTKEAKAHNAVSSFWNVTREFAKNYEKGKNDSIKWNVLLRKLEYTGFADKSGKGIIHAAEPTQAVFLTKSAFTVIDKVLNKRYSDGSANWTGGVWENGIWETAYGKTAYGKMVLGKTEFGKVALGKVVLGKVALGKVALGKVVMIRMINFTKPGILPITGVNLD